MLLEKPRRVVVEQLGVPVHALDVGVVRADVNGLGRLEVVLAIRPPQLRVSLAERPVLLGLAAVTFLSYVFVYTPLKRTTSMCVLVGAIPGALPPVIGWAAATGGVSLGGWLLFAIVYFWQLPHFAAIAWKYREDYARAGYPMLSVIDPDGTRTNLHVVTHTVALIVASLLPALYGVSGVVYGAGAVLLGIAFLVCGIRFLANKTRESARWHVLASIVYLPVLLTLLLLDKL